MGDTLDITAGAGTTIATDDVDGSHYQRIKLSDGTADASGVIAADIGVKANALRVAPANDITDGTYIGDIKFGEALATVTNLAQLGGQAISMGEGVVAAGCQRVTLATDDDGVAHLATIATDTNNIETAVQLIDDAIYVDDADWTDSTSKHMLIGGIYQSAPQTITDGDTGPLQVTSTGALLVSGGGGGTEYDEDVATPATITGTATMMERDDVIAALTPAAGDWAAQRCSAEGALWVQDFNSDAALALLGTIDGDTSNITACNTGAVVLASGTVTTVSTVTSLSQMSGVAITMGEGALDGGCQRVTLATDDDGVAHLSTIAAAVSTQMQCDIVAALPAGDNNIGNVDIVGGTVTTVSTVTNLSQMSGTAITMDEGVHDGGCQRVTIATDDDGVLSLGIIDDWDATHDSAASADGPQLMAAYDATKPTAVADGDAVRVLADEYGRLLSGVEKTRWQAVYDSADASGEGEAVHASAASTIIVVESYIISSDTELWVKLQEEDSTALTGKYWLKAGGGVAITLPDKAPLILGVDSDLEVIAEGAGDISVSASGYTIPG